MQKGFDYFNEIIVFKILSYLLFKIIKLFYNLLFLNFYQIIKFFLNILKLIIFTIYILIIFMVFDKIFMKLLYIKLQRNYIMKRVILLKTRRTNWTFIQTVQTNHLFFYLTMDFTFLYFYFYIKRIFFHYEISH